MAQVQVSVVDTGLVQASDPECPGSPPVIAALWRGVRPVASYQPVQGCSPDGLAQYERAYPATAQLAAKGERLGDLDQGSNAERVSGLVGFAMNRQ